MTHTQQAQRIKMTFFVRGVDMGSTFVVSIMQWRHLFQKTLKYPANTSYNHHMLFWLNVCSNFKIEMLPISPYWAILVQNSPNIANNAIFPTGVFLEIFCSRICDICEIVLLKSWKYANYYVKKVNDDYKKCYLGPEESFWTKTVTMTCLQQMLNPYQHLSRKNGTFWFCACCTSLNMSPT